MIALDDATLGRITRAVFALDHASSHRAIGRVLHHIGGCDARSYEVAPSFLFARFFTCSYNASRMRSLRVNIRPGCRARSSSTSLSSSAISAFGMRMLNCVSSSAFGLRGTSAG